VDPAAAFVDGVWTVTIRVQAESVNSAMSRATLESAGVLVTGKSLSGRFHTMLIAGYFVLQNRSCRENSPLRLAFRRQGLLQNGAVLLNSG